MKSIKEHFSLILALLSILFSVQIYLVAERSLEAYKENLSKLYSVVVVSQNHLTQSTILGINSNIASYMELEPDDVIKKLNTKMDAKNIELLKVTLPKFYKISLKSYPTPSQIKKLNADLLRHPSITKVEDFSHSHDSVYKLLLLFKAMVFVFVGVVVMMAVLLIFKELRIWQYKHSERMSIMGLFGAPLWLRSAVLFRLAIVDALLASFFAFGIFAYLGAHRAILSQFESIGIKVLMFNGIDDYLRLLAISLSLSLLLAIFIVLGHKEEA